MTSLPSQRWLAGLLAGSLTVWAPLGALEAAPSPSSFSSSSTGAGTDAVDVQQRWDDVKALLARQAWREALQALSDILRAAPNDPKALAYRQLCQRRLSEGSRFRAVSSGELEAVRETLQREQDAQAKAAAERKVLERQIKQEQAGWDAELKRLHQQTVRDEKTRERREKHAAVERRRQRVAQLQATQRPSPPPSAPTGPPSVAPPAPESVVASTTGSVTPTPPSPEAPLPPTQQSIELAPAAVPEAPTVPPVEEVPSEPIPTPAQLPPGAVNILADQLSASTDRRLAVARGHVRVIFSDGILTCDQATLFTDTKDVYAEGRVRLEQGAEVYRGEIIHYNLDTKKGRFLEGTAYNPPWYEHGRTIEHIAEGVLRTQPGYVTSCELEPPHFRFQGRRNIVFTEDKIVRSRNVALLVDELPFIYLPWLSLADRKTPFFLIPGKTKPWEQFVLMGYRYEWPAGNTGTLRLDWRRAFLWGFGIEDQFDDKQFGKGLFKAYYNGKPNMRATNPKKDTLPKGAALDRYRVLFRHNWQVMPDTLVVTDIQKYSDKNFRRDFLFRDEFVSDDQPESFVSIVTSDPNFTMSTTIKKRMNRFQGVTEAFPDSTFQITPKQIGGSQFYTSASVGFANLQSKTAHSDEDTDVVRLDWFQQLQYAVGLFRPVLVTPKVGIRQTYYTKDKQGGAERLQGDRHVISGQLSGGADASLKLFRIFPIATNWLGLNINQLRHVLTPTVAYTYVRPPTVPNDLLNFAIAETPLNRMTFEIENKLQTKRRVGKEGGLHSVDLARLIVKLPYTFRGSTNKQRGRLGDWTFDLETYPWPWLRLESDLTVPSHFVPGTRDSRIPSWNTDLVVVGGQGTPRAEDAREVQAPSFRTFEPGEQFTSGVPLLPQGQWYLGLGHRYSQNDKTEDVLQFDWRLSEKWQIGTFHRFTLKEVAGSTKRFNNLREYQYTLTRDLHDWVAEVVYRVDREFGEELFFTMTLKAYPEMPIEMEESYHQPKIGSQSSPFSPLRNQRP